MSFCCAKFVLIIAIVVLRQHVALCMFCKPSGSKTCKSEHGTVLGALRPRTREGLLMQMYPSNSVDPVNNMFMGYSAFYTSISKQMFVINDGVAASFDPRHQCVPHIVCRSFAREIITAFDRDSDWQEAMSDAVTSLQKKGVDGATSTLVVRNVWSGAQNTVEVLGDAPVVLLRLDKKTKQYKVQTMTRKLDVKPVSTGKRDSVKRLQIAGRRKSRYSGDKVENMLVNRFVVEDQDLVIGASDTFWNIVTPQEIAILARDKSPRELAAYLKEMAKSMGDLTVVVSRMVASNIKRPSPLDEDLISDQHNCVWMAVRYS